MNDTLIFFVLAMIALVFKWLTKLGAEKNESQPPPSPNNRTPRPPAQSEAGTGAAFSRGARRASRHRTAAPIRRREGGPACRRQHPPRTSQNEATGPEQMATATPAAHDIAASAADRHGDSAARADHPATAAAARPAAARCDSA